MKLITALYVWLFAMVFCCQAQTYRTGVLIYGNGNSALSAALQASKSGAKTTWLIPEGNIYLQKKQIPKIPTGMAQCLIDTILQLDSTKEIPANYNERILAYLDTLKNLTLLRNIDIKEAKRKSNYWDITLNSNTPLKADEVVDASIQGIIAKASGAKIDSINKLYQNLSPLSNMYWEEKNTAILRTSIASIYNTDSTISLIPISALLSKNIDHLVLIGKENTANFALGQAAGALAAYGSFFKSQTPQLYKANVRIVQDELLNYGLSIFKLKDINHKNRNHIAIQRTLLCGFFAPKTPTTTLLFAPQKPVTGAEIQPVLQKYFFKTAIWFEDHPTQSAELSIKDAIDLICYLSNKGLIQSTERIKKNWDKEYGFGDFDSQKTINREQFAVLVKDYLLSYTLKIDLYGQIRE